MLDFLRKINRFLRYSWSQIRQVVLWPYYFIITHDAFWARRHREMMEEYKKHTPKLNPLQQKILRDLRADGISLVNFEDLFPGSGLLAEMQKLTEELIDPEKRGRKKEFLNYFLNEKDVKDLDNPFLRFALHENILEVIGAYLGSYPLLRFFSGNVTRPEENKGNPQGSQRWHRDPGLYRICKIFLYLNDVPDAGSGPFTYIKGSAPGYRYGNFHKQILFGEDGYYPPEGAVERDIPRKEILQYLGKAGTVIFCNTTGLHKGGLSLNKERKMFTALYKYNRGTIPPEIKYPQNFEENYGTLGELGKKALSFKKV